MDTFKPVLILFRFITPFLFQKMERALQYYKNSQNQFAVKDVSASEIQVSEFCHPKLSEHLYDSLSKVPATHWVVNISYKQGDTQLGLTGKVHIKTEHIRDDVVREIQEETSLSTCKFDLRCVSGEKGMSIYTLNLDNSIAYVKKMPKKPQMRDRSSHRVGVLIHASLERLMDVLKDLIGCSGKIIHEKNIQGITLMPVSLAIKLFKKDGGDSLGESASSVSD